MPERVERSWLALEKRAERNKATNIAAVQRISIAASSRLSEVSFVQKTFGLSRKRA